MWKPNPEQTKRIEALCDTLVACSSGEMASYRKLARAIGEPNITSQSYELRRAIKLAETRAGAFFQNVKDEGYKRLPTAEVPEACKRTVKGIRGRARRGRQRVEKLRANDVTPAVAAYRSHFGIIESLAKEHTVNRIKTALEADRMPTLGVIAKGLNALMKG